MTTIGRATSSREAVVRLTVRGTGGVRREIDAVMDTGFNGYLALPARLVETLDLQGLGREQVTLASGEVCLTRKYEASVQFAGELYPVEVVVAGESIIGMALLWGHELRIHCKEGGRVLVAGPSIDE